MGKEGRCREGDEKEGRRREGGKEKKGREGEEKEGRRRVGEEEKRGREGEEREGRRREEGRKEKKGRVSTISVHFVYMVLCQACTHPLQFC